MLELRPGCEHCDRDLPPDAEDAMICSFECTFCRDCVATVLANVCPNCGGGFERRPVRPRTEHRPGVSLAARPAATERRHRPVDPPAHAELVERVGSIPPARR